MRWVAWRSSEIRVWMVCKKMTMNTWFQAEWGAEQCGTPRRHPLDWKVNGTFLISSGYRGFGKEFSSHWIQGKIEQRGCRKGGDEISSKPGPLWWLSSELCFFLFRFFFFSLVWSFPKIWETTDMTVGLLLLSQVFSPDSVYNVHRGGVSWFKRKISLMTETIHAVGIKILRKVGRGRQPQNDTNSPVQTQGSPILSH